jgi:uncharacterized protein YjgD (DUF1641 family)
MSAVESTIDLSPGERAILAALSDLGARVSRLEADVAKMSAVAQEAGPAISMAVDSVDDLLARHFGSGIEVEERVRVLVRTVERVSRPQALKTLETLIEHMDVLQRLLDSGAFAPGAVDVVSRAGLAVRDANAEAPSAVGLWGLLTAFNEPDVRRAAGFGVRFLRRFGRLIQT